MKKQKPSSFFPWRFLLLAGCLFSLTVWTSPIMAETKKTSIEQLVKDANKGDAKAQFELGVRYGKGDGVGQNYKEAVKWVKKRQNRDMEKLKTSWLFAIWKGRA